ncbi:MAG: PHP domain-containing protein, partial [Christensenella sp.]|uniref:PHP domain-containing protein n=1 Tax=Christensenella sp. TaxID=1935934 RepID=UPI002B20D07F
MIEIAWDTHTHTIHSHGTGTVEDNVRAAIQKGFTKIVISDHGVGHLFYNIRDVDAYLKDIDAMRKKYKNDIEVLSGAEMNLLSAEGDIDLPEQLTDAFDINLMGYHKLARFRGLKNKLHFLLPKSSSEAAVARNTQAYINAMDRYRIDIITHIGYGIPVDKLAVARHAAKVGTALEINAKHPEFTTEELIECAKTGVLFSIGSDAHSTDRIGDFAPALKKAEEAGIAEKQIINARRNEP